MPPRRPNCHRLRQTTEENNPTLTVGTPIGDKTEQSREGESPILYPDHRRERLGRTPHPVNDSSNHADAPHYAVVEQRRHTVPSEVPQGRVSHTTITEAERQAARGMMKGLLSSRSQRTTRSGGVRTYCDTTSVRHFTPISIEHPQSMRRPNDGPRGRGRQRARRHNTTATSS